MVFLGLPHGALDHLAPLHLRQRRLTPWYMLCFVVGYLVCVVVYLLFWHVFPAAALCVFLLLSWLHWGQGDAYYLEIFEDAPPPRHRAERLLRWLVRGGLPIVLPALAYPQVFAQVAGGIVGWYGTGGDWHLGESWRSGGFGLLAGLIVAYLLVSWSGSRRGFRRDAWEIGLLLAYFSLVPPILAIGVYFCVWHSARHMARLLLLDPANALPMKRSLPAGPLLRMVGQAIPMTLGALLLMAGLFWWQGRTRVDAGSLVMLYLSLIAALTFPHFLLVLWMDRVELVERRPYPVVIGSGSDPISDGL